MYVCENDHGERREEARRRLKIYTGSDLRVQKNIRAPGTTLSKSDLEELDNINKYRSFVVHLMWYTKNVGPEVANAARELAVHMIHPEQDYWKALGRLIGYIKGKEAKCIISLAVKRV